jgi:hypothetical protein
LSDKTEYEKVANYTKTLDQKSQDITSKYDNVTVSPANAKSYDRIIEKAKLDYGGDVSMVMDIVRNTFVASEDIKEELIADIKKSFNVVRVKHQNFPNLGYTGTVINFKSTTGIIGEIQINTPQMIYAKEPNARQIIGTKLYDEIRSKSGIEGGLGHKYYERYRVLSPEQDAIERAEIAEQSRMYYEKIRAVPL